MSQAGLDGHGAAASRAAGKVSPSTPGSPPPGTIRTYKEITCQRTMEFDLVRFTWNVENFSWYRESRGVQYDVLESPHFQTEDGQYDWVLRLIIHPRPDRPGDELCRDSVQIFLHLHNAPRDTASLKCQFVFVRQLPSNKDDHTYQISRFREFRRGETWGFRRFIQRTTLFDQKNGFLQSADRLTVKINLDIVKGIRDEVQRPIRTTPAPKDNLPDDLQRLCQRKNQSDVIIVAAGGVEVEAHKSILSARSVVFEAMWKHNLAEKRTNRIEMKDTPKEVLDTFLQMIYTNQSDHLDDHAVPILDLAERYQIMDVKYKAVDALRRTLCETNVADFLEVADLHNVPDLKDDAVEYIIINYEKVKNTDGYKDFVLRCPTLVAHVMDCLFGKKQRVDKYRGFTG